MLVRISFSLGAKQGEIEPWPLWPPPLFLRPYFINETSIDHSNTVFHAHRSELAEKETVLRTKVTRERDNFKTTLRHYRFTLLRVRMPNGLIVQGVHGHYV